jgi:membrane glycosyltransferase
MGLFLLPEETEPPTVLSRAREVTEEHAVAPVADAVDHVLTDARAHALHLALLEAQPGLETAPVALAEARRKLLGGAMEPLSPPEKTAVLLDAGTLAEARERRLARVAS